MQAIRMTRPELLVRQAWRRLLTRVRSRRSEWRDVGLTAAWILLVVVAVLVGSVRA